jgi:hypothetical protein
MRWMTAVLLAGLALAREADAQPRGDLRGARAFAVSRPECRRGADVLEDSVHRAAAADDEHFPTYLCFHAGGAPHGVTGHGEGWRFADGAPPRPFRVRMLDDFDLESMRYAAADGRLYLLYQVTSGGDGMGYLDAFDGRTLQPLWSEPAAVSINLGSVLLAGSAGYATGLNVIGKLDLGTGAWLWKHRFCPEALEAGHLISFELPRREAGRVVFREARMDDRAARVLVLDDATGAILAPAELRGPPPPAVHSPCAGDG